MRRLAPTLLVALFLTVGTASESSADTAGCVSRHEYDRISKGMTMTRVHAIFDTEGAPTGLGGSTPIRYYKTCSRMSQVQVTFSARGRVLTKSANWY